MLQTNNNTPLGVAFFKAYVNGKEVTNYAMEKFQYAYSEDGTDICQITINTKDPKAPDDPIFFDDVRWVLIWGFISGKTKQRVAYVQDVKWEFSKVGRKFVVELCEQAVSMKKDKSQAMYGSLEQPADIVMVALAVCQTLGLNLVIKGNKDDTKPEVPGQINISPQDTEMAKWYFYPYSGVTAWNGQYPWDKSLANAPQTVDSAIKETLTALGNAKPQQFNFDNNVQAFIDKATGVLNRDGISPLTQYVGKVAANKTHAHVIDELSQYDGITAETRDEDLILKRRNFNKPPLRSYEYGNNEELLSFVPETKHRSKSGAAVNTLFSLWDASNKEFTQGMIDLKNILLKPIAVLSQYMKESGYQPSLQVTKMVQDKQNASLQVLQTKYQKLLSAIPNSQSELDNIELQIAEASNIASDSSIQMRYDIAAGLVMDARTPEEQHIADVLLNTAPQPGTKLQNGANIDQTGIIRRNTKSLTVRQLRDEYTKVIQTLSNQMHDPVARTNADAYKKAYNALEDSNLQMNPATGIFWGDTDHETGIILTILGLGKRYSSNYYIIKSTHTLEHEGSYTVTNEFCTHGSNVKMVSNNRALTDANRFINKEIGKVKNSTNSKGLTSEKNQR